MYQEWGGWAGSCRGGVGCGDHVKVGWGGSCRGGVGCGDHVKVGCVM